MQKFAHNFPHAGRRQQVDAILFDSLSDFAEHVRPLPSRVPKALDDWAGGTREEALRRLTEGDLTLVAKSDALLTKFEQLAFETTRLVTCNDVCGAFPDVPAYIAGFPMNMRRRRRQESAAAPIVIFCDVAASASFSQDAITKRGAVVLALARILTARRPVELYVGMTTHNHAGRSQAFAIRMETQPLDLARAAYAVASPLFVRRVAIDCLAALGAASPTPAPGPNSMGPTSANIAAMLPASSQTIICPALISSNNQAWKDPEAWIVDQIRRAAPEMLDDAA